MVHPIKKFFSVEKKGKEKYEFDEVCKILYIYKSKNNFGDMEQGLIGIEDSIVLGLETFRGSIYRGIVPKILLDSFPSNIPAYGQKYRIQAKYKPFVHKNINVLKISNILPSRNFLSLFF